MKSIILNQFHRLTLTRKVQNHNLQFRTLTDILRLNEIRKRYPRIIYMSLAIKMEQSSL